MGTPTITSASSNADGTIITIVFSEAVTGTTGFMYSHDIFSILGIYTQPTGSGTTWTLTVERPAVGGSVMKLWYVPGDFKSVSTNTNLAYISRNNYIPITNNIAPLEYDIAIDGFDVFLDPGYRNPPRKPQTPVRLVTQNGACITYNTDGNGKVTSFQMDYAKIDSVCAAAALAGLPIVWDNENAPFNSVLHANVEASRKSFKVLYDRCKTQLALAGKGDIPVAHYDFPSKTFWGINSLLQEWSLYDIPPRSGPTNSYNAWVALNDRINQVNSSITFSESEITPGLFTVTDGGGTSVTPEEWVWCDMLCPDNYAYYDDVLSYVEVNRELYKVFKDKFSRNGTIPIFPYIWFQFHDNTPAIANWTQGEFHWRQTMNICREYCDGAVIWGGYAIGRPTSVLYRSHSSYSQTFANTALRFSGVSNGHLRLRWMNTDIEINGLDFTGVSTSNLVDVCNIIETAINSNKPTPTAVNYNVQGTEHLQSTEGVTLSVPADVVVDTTLYQDPTGHIIIYHNNDYDKALVGRNATYIALLWPFKRIDYNGGNTEFRANLSKALGWTVNTSSPVTISRKIEDIDLETESTSSVSLASGVSNSMDTNWDCDPEGFNFLDIIDDDLLAPSPANRRITYTFTNTSLNTTATLVFDSLTCDGEFLGAPQYLHIANGLLYYYDHPYTGVSFPYNEFELYVASADWWNATLDMINRYQSPLSRGQKYIKSLRPIAYFEMPASTTVRVKEEFGSGFDLLFFNQQYINNPAGHESYPQNPPEQLWGTRGPSFSMKGVKFNGNHVDANAQPTGTYSEGGFMHHSPPRSNRSGSILGLSGEWTTCLWFKPSATPITTAGNQSVILFCGYSDGTRRKFKGPSFIYDDASGTYNNGTSTVAYPSGPKLVWHHSSDFRSDLYGVTTGKTILPINTTFQENKWYMIASRFNYDTLTWDVFVNGVLDNSITVPSPATTRTWRWAENTWAINGFDTANNTTGATSRSNHTIGDIVAYRRLLTDSEIRRMYRLNRRTLGSPSLFF